MTSLKKQQSVACQIADFIREKLLINATQDKQVTQVCFQSLSLLCQDDFFDRICEAGRGIKFNQVN